MRSGHCPLNFAPFVLANPQVAKQTDKDQLDLATSNSYLYENVYKKDKSEVTILHRYNAVTHWNDVPLAWLILCTFLKDQRHKYHFQLN